ncbi:hypothetical protein PV760_12970, partial [Paenarthrobacter sp. CC6]
GIGKQLASSLTMSGIVNYKSPLLDMNVTGKFSGLSRSWLDEFEKDGTEGFVASLREDLAVDPALALEIDEIFERLGAPEDLLDETAEFLNLTMPFGHDSAVRTGLQIVAVTSLFAILLMIFLSNPFLGAVLSAVGTPNVAVSWKATGKAYDRLYGLEAKPKPGAKSSKGGKPGLLANGRGRKRSGRW